MRAPSARVRDKIILLASLSRLFAQSPSLLPDRPWHSFQEQQVISEAQRIRLRSLRAEPDKLYSR